MAIRRFDGRTSVRSFIDLANLVPFPLIISLGLCHRSSGTCPVLRPLLNGGAPGTIEHKKYNSPPAGLFYDRSNTGPVAAFIWLRPRSVQLGRLESSKSSCIVWVPGERVRRNE